jgi:hypothetical protein
MAKQKLLAEWGFLPTYILDWDIPEQLLRWSAEQLRLETDLIKLHCTYE